MSNQTNQVRTFPSIHAAGISQTILHFNPALRLGLKKQSVINERFDEMPGRPEIFVIEEGATVTVAASVGKIMVLENYDVAAFYENLDRPERYMLYAIRCAYNADAAREECPDDKG